MASCIPVDGIYETIKSIDVNVKYHNERVNKIIEHLKFVKMGRRVLNEINSGYSPSRFLSTTANTSGEINDENKDISFDLTQELSQLKIKSTSQNDEKESKSLNQDFQTKFYSQLYQLLRKRKKIPTMSLSLNKLELKEEKYDASVSTHVVLEDSSFTGVKSSNQSPVKQTQAIPAKVPLTAQKSIVPEITKTFQEIPKSVADASKTNQINIPSSQPLSTQPPVSIFQQAQPQKQLIPSPLAQTQPVQASKADAAPKSSPFSFGASTNPPAQQPSTTQTSTTPLFGAQKPINQQLNKLIVPATPPNPSQVVTSTPATNAPISFNNASPVPFPKTTEPITQVTNVPQTQPAIQKSLFGNLGQPQTTSDGLFGTLTNQQKLVVPTDLSVKTAETVPQALSNSTTQTFSFNLNKAQTQPAQATDKTYTTPPKPSPTETNKAETKAQTQPEKVRFNFFIFN